MPPRTQLFQMLNWDGGLNTSDDESRIGPNQLTRADNMVFGVRTSRKMRDGINHNWDDLSAGSASVIGLHDYWFGSSSRVQRQISVHSDRKVYSKTSGGVSTLLTDGGTAWSGTLSECTMTTFNNLVIIGVDGSGNKVKKWSGSGNMADLDGSPNAANLVGVHQGRLLLNDKNNPDQLQYCPIGDHTTWGGTGDSGVIVLPQGDGDPRGITAFKSFKGDLFIWKKTKLYRVSGIIPDHTIELISDGVGCESHNSVTTIDTEDMVWVSDKGVHSLSATANYGDFQSTYVSFDIQKTFNEDLDFTRLRYCSGAYNPQINSVAFAFTETSALNRSLTTNSVNNAVYLYNFSKKAWYRWPDLPCQSLIVANDTDKKRFYFGTHTGRTSKSFNGTNYDITSSGSHVAIKYGISTGQIFPDQNPYSMKIFKRFILYYKPQGTHSISATVKVDNHAINSENQLTFSEVSSTALLGTTFILGSSSLGYSVALGPYSRTIDGYGRGVKINIDQNVIDSTVEIQGFAVEWEPAGNAPETFLT